MRPCSILTDLLYFIYGVRGFLGGFGCCGCGEASILEVNTSDIERLQISKKNIYLQQIVHSINNT